MTRWVDRKVDDVTADTLRLRSATDDELWKAPYRHAARRIEEHARDGKRWCKVKLPFACDDEMEDWYEHVLTVASVHGFERRPGGAAGNGFDLVFFERVEP